MGEKINDGGPAFPEAYWPTVHSDAPNFRGGMSLRDWFAGQALAGRLAQAESLHWTDTSIVLRAYEFADAMIRAREVKL